MSDLNSHNKFYNVPFGNIEEFNGMPYRRLGSSGLMVSDVGLGTWKIGYPETGDGSRIGEDMASRIFERAVELGVTFWDTANRYNNASGNAERVIGGWLRKNPAQRRNVILATKIYGGMDGITPNHWGLSRNNILDAVYTCLDRLQTGYIDLLYFHAFDQITPPEESLMAIEDLVRQDLVRYFGVSNFTSSNLISYQSVLCDRTIRSKIVAVQNQYDMLHEEPAFYTGVREYASRMGMSFIAWSPLAEGLLTGKYLDGSKVGKGDRLFDEGKMSAGSAPSDNKKLKRLAGLSHQWGMELSQLALSYLLALPGMGPVIPSSATLSQLESNAAAARIKLNDDQLSGIREALLDT
jgi:aryl-alcohol dehydrogenase-like predicted oxidoreductase